MMRYFCDARSKVLQHDAREDVFRINNGQGDTDRKAVSERESAILYRMGEARRKKARQCICGSGLPAAACCYGYHGWMKKAAFVRIDQTGHLGSHDKCYLNSTKACSDQITKEHLISHSVLKILAEKFIEISGAPWLKPNEKKVLPFGSLVLHIALLAFDRPVVGTPLQNSGYRPGRIKFIVGDIEHTILLSWDDGFNHGYMTLSWEK